MYSRELRTLSVVIAHLFNGLFMLRVSLPVTITEVSAIAKGFSKVQWLPIRGSDQLEKCKILFV